MALEDMSKLFMSLGGIAIILVVAFLIVAQGQSQIASIEGLNVSNASDLATSVAYNSSQTIQTSMEDAVDWLPIVIITVIGAMLIGLVAFFRKRR